MIKKENNIYKNNKYVSKIKCDLKEKLDEIKKEQNIFENNWDGYDSTAISQKSIDMMFDYLNCFDKDIEKPEIMLEPYGTIALYWGTKKGNFFISFNDKINKIEFALTNKYTRLNMFGILESIDDVKYLLKWIS